MQAEDGETFEQLPIRPFFVYFDNSPVEEFTLVLSNLLCQRPSSVFPTTLADTNSASLSPVHIIAIIDSPAYFTEEFFQKLKALDYPKNLLTITIVAKNDLDMELYWYAYDLHKAQVAQMNSPIPFDERRNFSQLSLYCRKPTLFNFMSLPTSNKINATILNK